MELSIQRFTLETHGRNGGSKDPYKMTHEVTILASIGDRTFHEVDDDSADDNGSIGTIEKVLKKILIKSGISESKIPKLASFSVPNADTHLLGAASEVEVTMIFEHDNQECECKKMGKDVLASALEIFVSAYNQLIE